MATERTHTAGKKSKRTDKRPARLRYWAGRHLERNKVKNLMRHNGMTRAEAILFWSEVRSKRIPDGFLIKTRRIA